MRRRLRRRWRVVKWVGTVLCVLILVVGLLSLFVEVLFNEGVAAFVHARFFVTLNTVTLADFLRPEFAAHEIDMVYRLRWAYHLPSWETANVGGYYIYVSIPLWMPLLLIAIPTALLWYRDRRRSPAGHCQSCGYDLTGNVSGRCPECGTPIASAGEAA